MERRFKGLIIFAVHKGFARGGLMESDQHAHRGRLTCPIGTQKTGDFTVGNDKRHIVNGGFITVPLGKILNL